jgi:murein DD-endopeptidase MepM/ murein hydrolase activator NlpD
MTTHRRRILTQSIARLVTRSRRGATRGQWLAVVLAGLSGLAAFSLIANPAPEIISRHTIAVALPLPELSAVDAASIGYWREDRIRRGDTIGSALARMGVDDPAALDFLRTNAAARALYQLRPGRPLNVETDEVGRLIALRFVTTDGTRLSIGRDGERLVVSSVPAAADVRWVMAAAEIQSSLFGAADAAGLPDAVTIQIAEVFGGDIDFYQDLRRGDRFAVVYEMRHIDGEPVAAGRIVAVQFENRGRLLRAFLWRGEDGSEDYYSETGMPMRKAFLRSPMEFSRVTSGFSDARFHPILQSWRAHKGVDYAAPTGTPVRATGNATVEFAGTQTGYGNVIELRHSNGVSTLYAHLSGFAPQTKSGSRVNQGQVIGYVGQTGWATGPHLHYEFRVAGEQRNPLTVALPSSEPLVGGERASFGDAIVPAVAQLRFARQFTGKPILQAD